MSENILTPEIKEKLKQFRAEWLKVGMSTEPCDRERSEKTIGRIYEMLGRDTPTFVWADSPKQASVIIHMMKQMPEGKEVPPTKEEIDNFNGTFEFSPTYMWGSMEAFWVAFYLFPREHLGVEYEDDDNEKLELWKTLAESCGWWWAFERFVICSERPVEFHINENEELHRDGGPAISYRDGFSIYALNSVRVSKELTETPAMELDPKMLFSEKNVEIKREIVRKIGIERFVQQVGGEVIDSKEVVLPNGDIHAYELILMDIGLDKKKPYLKMLNPSIGTWHVEGVHPSCKTVDDALEFRNGTKELPQHLS